MISNRSSLRKIYLSEIDETIAECNTRNDGFYNEKDFSSLPEIIQKYFVECGYIGKKKSKISG